MGLPATKPPRLARHGALAVPAAVLLCLALLWAVLLSLVDTQRDATLLRAAAVPASGVKCRIHGALRLQELVLANNDFVLVDFEGDLSRPIAERRHKQSPLRDVASLLHSFTLARLAALQMGAHAEAEQLRREALARSCERLAREVGL